MSKGSIVAPWKCCEVFYALAVTDKHPVDQLFMHYFHNFSSAPYFLLGGGIFGGSDVGVVHLVVLSFVLACVLRATTKKGRQLFWRKKCTSQRKSWLRLEKNPVGAYG